MKTIEKSKSATLTVAEIQNFLKKGWTPEVYRLKNGYVCEVDWTRNVGPKNKHGLQSIAGFTYMSCEIRQRELKSLVRRIQKVLPKFKVKMISWNVGE